MKTTIFCGYRYYLGNFEEINKFCNEHSLTLSKVRENTSEINKKKIYKNQEYYTTTPKWIDYRI